MTTTPCPHQQHTHTHTAPVYAKTEAARATHAAVRDQVAEVVNPFVRVHQELRRKYV